MGGGVGEKADILSSKDICIHFFVMQACTDNMNASVNLANGDCNMGNDLLWVNQPNTFS